MLGTMLAPIASLAVVLKAIAENGGKSADVEVTITEEDAKGGAPEQLSTPTEEAAPAEAVEETTAAKEAAPAKEETPVEAVEETATTQDAAPAKEEAPAETVEEEATPAKEEAPAEAVEEEAAEEAAPIEK